MSYLPLRVALFGALAASALALVPAGSAVVSIQGAGTKALPNVDVRRSHVAPTARQLSAARALRAHVRWTKQGTPSSVLRYGHYLATGVRGMTAASAATSWLSSHKALFRL